MGGRLGAGRYAGDLWRRAADRAEGEDSYWAGIADDPTSVLLPIFVERGAMVARGREGLKAAESDALLAALALPGGGPMA